jgi:hypothetical protein
MNRDHITCARCCVVKPALAALFLVVLVGLDALQARGASWKGIEPLKSRRADVERVLGAPVRESASDGGLHFNVSGGKVTVFFVSSKLVAARKLAPGLEGTVLQIVLQHERASDTPASLGLDKDKKFEREEKGSVVAYANPKDGLAYTFIGGRLATTRYAVPAEQWTKHLKRG